MQTNHQKLKNFEACTQEGRRAESHMKCITNKQKRSNKFQCNTQKRMSDWRLTEVGAWHGTAQIKFFLTLISTEINEDV